MCQISSVIAAAEGPVAEFSSFANFEEKKRKSNLLMSFPKTGSQMGSFGQIRKKSFFRFCRPILDIFGFTLLRQLVIRGSAFALFIAKQVEQRRFDWQDVKSIQDQATTFFLHYETRPVVKILSVHLGIIIKQFHPLFPRLAEPEIIPLLASLISKIQLLTRRITDAECAKVTVQCFITGGPDVVCDLQVCFPLERNGKV